jgi:hypothetical protein
MMVAPMLSAIVNSNSSNAGMMSPAFTTSQLTHTALRFKWRVHPRLNGEEMAERR